MDWQAMHFEDLVAPDAVALGVPAAGKRAVFERAGALVAAGDGISAGEVADALMARERLGTTGFGGGTAIPHGRVPSLDRQRGAILLLAAPLDWDAVDGVPVDLVLVLAGPVEAGADHLKALARASRALRDKGFVAKLRGARDPAALWALLAGRDRRAA